MIAQQLADSLLRQLRDKLHQLQSMSIMTLPTLLDPHFKTLSQTKANEAVKRLTSRGGLSIRAIGGDALPRGKGKKKKPPDV